MCQTRSNMNSSGQQNNLYPDLSGMNENQSNQSINQGNPSIMDLLQALGLVPPHPPQGGQGQDQQQHHAPSAPPPSDEQHQPPQPPPQQQGSQHYQENHQGARQHHYHGCPSQSNWPRNSSNWNWQSWNNTSPTPCGCSILAGLSRVIHAVKLVFKNSMTATALFMMALLIHIIIPFSIIHNVVFLFVAAGLGLPLHVLLAGQAIKTVLGCLAASEPVLLIILLVWAAHKTLVRRQPLFDSQYWGNRFGNLRVVINNGDN